MGEVKKRLVLRKIFVKIPHMTHREQNAENPLPTTPEALLELLQVLEIPYDLHHHAPIFTVDEGLHLKESIPGTHCRNLFLKDKKNAMFLLTLANETKVDLKALPEQLGCGRLSFGSKERLMTHLGIYPGAVTPFAAINDINLDVNIILDQTMMEAALMNVHPLDNAMTVGFAPDGLLRFYAHTGHKPSIMQF